MGDLKDGKSWFSVLLCIYCVFTVMQNIFEMKTVGSATFALMGGGTVVSWITFLIMDIMSEVYGKKRAVSCFSLAGILNIVVVLLAQLIIFMPGTYQDQNTSFAQIFSNGPRTVLASFIAFWIGNYVNVHIMVKLKGSATKDSGFLFWFRAVLSTIIGQLLDNAIFLVIAFAPLGISAFEMRWVDMISVVILGTSLETIIESVFVPLITIPVTRKLLKLEK